MTIYILLCILGLISYYFYNNREDRKIKLIDQIPGPPGLPVIGNLLLGLTPVGKSINLFFKNIDAYIKR